MIYTFAYLLIAVFLWPWFFGMNQENFNSIKKEYREQDMAQSTMMSLLWPAFILPAFCVYWFDRRYTIFVYKFPWED